MIEEEAEVRNWLEAVEAPPPRLDLGEIVQIGRAQVRRRRQVAAGGSAAVALAVVAALPVAVRAWPDPTGENLSAGQYPTLDCTITELPLPDGISESQDFYIAPAEMDPTGRYIVGNPVGVVTFRPATADPSGSEVVTPDVDVTQVPSILWDNGVPEVIPSLRGNADALAVNSSGVVVGTGYGNGNDWYGWVYRDGRATELPAPAGYRIFSVWDINEAGDIVGEVAAADAPDNSESRPVVWPAGSPDQPRFLPEPAGKQHVGELGVAITDDGTVVGTVIDEQLDDSSGEIRGARGYLWDANGVGHYLPDPSGATEAWVSAARGGWAVGYAKMRVPAESVWRSAEPTGTAGSPSQSPSVPPSDAPTDQPGGDVVELDTPVRWDLMSGAVEVLDPSQGRLRSNTYAADVAANGDIVLLGQLVYRDSDWFAVPSPVDFAHLTAIDDSGTVIAGEVPGNDATGDRPVVWHC